MRSGAQAGGPRTPPAGWATCGFQRSNYRSSYILYYNRPMADTITFRPDEDTKRALDALTADGTAVSTVVRSALIDAARFRALKRVRAEAEALAADPGDRAEAAQVLRDMEVLRAW